MRSRTQRSCSRPKSRRWRSKRPKQLGPDIVYLYHDRPGTVCAALCPHRRVSIIHSHRFQNAKVFPLHQPCRESFTKQSREPSFADGSLLLFVKLFSVGLILRRAAQQGAQEVPGNAQAGVIHVHKCSSMVASLWCSARRMLSTRGPTSVAAYSTNRYLREL